MRRMYRDYVVNSTRNIGKFTNDILVREKNNRGSSPGQMLRICTMKMQMQIERVCVTVRASVRAHWEYIFDKRMIRFKTRSAVIRKA